MGFFDKLKKWLKPKNEKIKDANRVTNYGGGVKRNDTVSEVKRSIQKAEKAKEKKQETQSTQSTTKGSAFKATPPSVKKAEAKDKQTSKPTRSSAFKATPPPTFNYHSTALGTLSSKETNSLIARRALAEADKTMREYQAAKLKPLIEAKYSGDTKESKQRIKSGEWMSDPNVAKYDVLKHPIANSLARGGLSGATFGLSELAAQKLPKSKEMEEAERVYQKNKNALAEGVGELAGSLAGFGLTGDLSKTALTKAAPKLTSKLGAGATEWLASNKLVQNAARKEALRTLGANATKEEIEHFAKLKAGKIVAALGEDAAINLTTGGASDILHSLAESDNPAEFVKNMGANALGNWLIGGALSAAPALRASNADDVFVRNRLAAREGLDDLIGRNRVGMGRPSELTLPKLDSFADASKAASRYPAIEDAYLDYDGTIEAVNRYYNPDATAEAAVKRYDDLEAPRRKPRTAEAPKAEPLKSAAEPKSKNWRDSLADSETYDDFVKQNAKNADLKAHMKETGKNPKEVWRDARIERGKQNLHRISDEEADRILWERIPENEVQGWFNDANSGYKPRILDRMAESPDTVNASLNVAYKNYLDSNPKNALSFDEWLDTPQTLYRGTRGQSKTTDDIFTAFTPNKDAVAKKFAGKKGTIEEITITPRETYGSVMHNLESEFLVPESAIKESATPAPKVEATTKPKKSKTPPTREERLANANGVDQYNARAEHQAERFEEGYEKADNVRAVLAGEEPKAPAKGAKPEAEKLNAKAETKATAPKNAAKKEPTVVEDLSSEVGRKREKTTMRDRINEFTGSFRRKISNSLTAFEDENRKLVHTDHKRWLDNNGAIDKVRRYSAQAGRSLKEGQLKWKGGKHSGKIVRNGIEIENGKSLMQIYDGMDKATENAFDQYLLLRHAPDRIRENKPIFANKVLKDGRSLNDPEVCKAEAERLLKEHPEFAKKAEEVYQYLENEMQNRVDAGLIKQDVVDEWRKKYPNYVPTGRDGDFSGDYDIWDIAGQIKNEGNTVGAGEIRKAVGSDKAIRSIKEQIGEATTRNWRDMSMNNLFRRMFGEEAATELARDSDGGIQRVLENTLALSKSKDGGKYYAEVFVDGDMRRVEIEKRFYEDIEDLYKNGRLGNGLDVLTDAASVPSGIFKNLITSWNPIFMVNNGFRDFPEAIINSRQTKEFLSSMGEARRDLLSNGEYTQALRDSGVSQSNFINLEEALTKKGGKLGEAVNKFATLQEMVETYPRLIEFMATFKKEGTTLKEALASGNMELIDRAAANAADVTVNFGRSGSVGKMLNKGFVPFFNPSVQGWSKFARNLSEQEGGKQLVSFLVKATALGAGVGTLNNVLCEDNPNYQMISPRDKATNYIIPWAVGKDRTAQNTDLFIKIPKSRFAAVYGLPSVNVANDNKMGWAEAIKIANDQIAPVDPLESNIFAQAKQLKENKTWYGTPIVPKSLEDLPKSEQYDVNTSNIGKALGKATQNLPKQLQISPKKADYAIDSLTGVVGDFALPMTTPSRQHGDKNVAVRTAKDFAEVPKRAFTIDATTRNNLSTRFYEKLDEANTNNQSAKGGKAEADEYKRLSGYSKEVSGINQAIKDVQGSKRETKKQDVAALQKVRNQFMQDAIDGKAVPSKTKTMDAVQKYVGTTYTINHFGSASDRDAMKLYGLAKYGNVSKQEMRKAINDDKDFYKGVRSIGKLDDKMAKADIKSNTVLSKAVALASSGSNDELFGAYGATYKSRTETDNKMNRSRAYFKDGGSEDEYVKLEKARKTMGVLPDDDEAKALDNLDKQVAKGEISLAERKEKANAIEYNANLSYVGLATSFAQINAPERGYRLYDIKDNNIQKGINLAAMGFTARDYKKMTKALDTDGNGYPSVKEIRAYVDSSGIQDKATLYDALYHYRGTYNPYGTPTKYTREQAAAMGRARGFESIDDSISEFKLNPSGTSGSGYGYYRRGYRRWHRWGGGSGGSGKGKAMDMSAFRGKNASTTKPTYKSLAENLKPANRDVRADYDTSSVKYQTAKAAKSAPKPKAKAVAKKTPPKVKFKKYEV